MNEYDNPDFFAAYGKLRRSSEGLTAAGEWPAFRRTLPPLAGKRVLDLGCGYGWHCRYAAEQGAKEVVGVDLSALMIAEAEAHTESDVITYVQASIADYSAPAGSFDVVISSLALHYVGNLADTFAMVHSVLMPGGVFTYSVEHPMFTARAEQAWHLDDAGNRVHWPVDDYFDEGVRETAFLGEKVRKYHRTVGSQFTELRAAGFVVESIQEPVPPPELLTRLNLQDEMRRPMMLVVQSRKD